MSKHQKEFTASFVTYGKKFKKTDGIKKTLLFRDIKYSDGTIFSEHNWFSYSPVFDLALKEGDVISFYATPQKYLKGYLGKREKYKETEIKISYKLVLVNNVKIIK